MSAGVDAAVPARSLRWEPQGAAENRPTPTPSKHNSEAKVKQSVSRGKARAAGERRATIELPPEKAFYFYRNLDEPLGVAASSIADFQKKLANVEPSSVKFHVERGDFQNWLRSLGEIDSAEKIDGLKGKGIPPEKMRERVTALVTDSLRSKKP